MMKCFVHVPMLLLASVAAAQSPASPAPPEPPPRTVVFEDLEEVGGRTAGPDAASTIVRLTPREDSLVRVRTDFRAALLQSAELL